MELPVAIGFFFERENANFVLCKHISLQEGIHALFSPRAVKKNSHQCSVEPQADESVQSWSQPDVLGEENIEDEVWTVFGDSV